MSSTNFSRPLSLLASVLGGCVLLASCGTPVVRNLAPSGPAVHVLAAGDIADCRRNSAANSGAEGTARLVERQLALEPGTHVITLGDHTYPVGLPQEFRDCFHPTWGRFKDKIMPSAGNHEYYTKDAPGYWDYFGEQAGPPGRGYYARTMGSWRVIALNSALRDAAFAEQLDWLKAELAGKKSHCTLVFFHHPVFSSGGHGNNAFMLPVWQLLHGAGVDLVLAAHDHHYERLGPMNASGAPAADGMRSFVVGTGGATLSPLLWPLPATEARDNRVHGLLQLELREGAYRWAFLPVDDVNFTDEGVGLCR